MDITSPLFGLGWFMDLIEYDMNPFEVSLIRHNGL